MTSEPYTYTPVYDFNHVSTSVQLISLSVPQVQQEKMKLFFTRDEYLEMCEELDAQKKEKKAKEAIEAIEAKEIKDLCTITNKQDTQTDILKKLKIFIQ
jgi:hypothetical protein